MHAEINLKGETNLLFYPEFQLGNVRRIMDFLESEQEDFTLFNKGIGTDRTFSSQNFKSAVFLEVKPIDPN